jgi:hypothetical protein
MDGSSSMEIIKKEHKKIVLLGFITCKSVNFKSSRINLFEGGYYDMTQKREFMGLNVYDITLMRGIYEVKCTCNV